MATSLPVANVRSVKRRETRCIKADVCQLMLKVEKLKRRGLSCTSNVMGGHVENVRWVNLTGRVKYLNWLHYPFSNVGINPRIAHIHVTGPPVRETVPAPLWRGRSLTLSFGKSGYSERRNTNSENATKTNTKSIVKAL